MNLFLVHWTPSGVADIERAEGIVRSFVGETPYFAEEQITSWKAPSERLAVAAVSHTRVQTAGISYVHAEASRIALFSGRPFRWKGDGDADGSSTLDARYYLGDPSVWSRELEGRCAVVRYDDEGAELDVFTDPLSIHHLYVVREGDERWISTTAELLRRVLGTRVSRLTVLACFFACGWSYGGQPRWEGIHRLPTGVLLRYRGQPIMWPDEAASRTHENAALIRGQFDPEQSASLLVAATRALADWPGRPLVLMLSGGRDSRVIFAAARRAGLQFEARTITEPASPQYPDSADVRLARELCEDAGVAHSLLEPPPDFDPYETARRLDLVAPGTVSLRGVARTLVVHPRRGSDRPLDLLFSGLGGEFSRVFYGPASRLDRNGVVSRLYRRTTFVWPNTIVNKHGASIYRGLIADWVDSRLALDVPIEDLLELFYIEERMGNWGAASTAIADYAGDVVSPLWSTRLLAQQYGLPEEERERQLFHVRLLRQLDPSLLDTSFDVQLPWTRGATARQPRARRVSTAMTLVRESRRRIRQRFIPPPGVSRDTFPVAAHAARKAIAAQPEHEAWAVLDRKRVQQLLARDPRRLDRRNREFLWRLATVFLTDAQAMGR